MKICLICVICVPMSHYDPPSTIRNRRPTTVDLDEKAVLL